MQYINDDIPIMSIYARADDEDEEPTTTLRSTSTHTKTSIITPTTLATQVYPYPSKASATIEPSPSASANATSSEIAKLEKDLQWHKTYHRNSAIAFSVLAVLIVGFVAFKTWRCIRHRKKKAINLATGGERKWPGQSLVRKVAERVV